MIDQHDNDECMENVPCPLGCQSEDLTLFEANDRLNGLPGIFQVVKCKKCGLIRTNPRPRPQFIANFYPESYGPYQYTRVKSVADKANSEIRGYKIKKILKKIFPLHNESLPKLNPGRMLELGCAAGAFMQKMKLKGWQVEGIETSVSASQMARKAGLKVFTGSIEKAPEPDHPFDLVVAWMVLEHLHQPLDVLKRLFDWTKTGGWLVASVPNAGSIDFKLFRQRWYALQVPTHLYHYTPRSINMILRSSGWQTVRIMHQRVLSNHFASAGYLLHDKVGPSRLSKFLIAYPERAGLLHYIIYPLAWILSLAGQTGRMTIWARKVGE